MDISFWKLIIHIFGIKRDTNNAVENWMGFVKNIEFGKKLRNLIPRFIQRHELTINGRYKEVIYGLVTTRQITKRKRKIDPNIDINFEENTNAIH